MNTLPKTIELIQPGQIVPNFSIQLGLQTSDFYTYRKDKWVVLFTHPEKFIPQKLEGFISFLKMKNFLKNNNAKLLGLNPPKNNPTSNPYFGKTSKIIVVDTLGIVRGVVSLPTINHSYIKKVLADLQLEVERERMYESYFNQIDAFINIKKIDLLGFQPIDLFLQNLDLN